MLKNHIISCQIYKENVNHTAQYFRLIMENNNSQGEHRFLLGQQCSMDPLIINNANNLLLELLGNYWLKQAVANIPKENSHKMFNCKIFLQCSELSLTGDTPMNQCSCIVFSLNIIKRSVRVHTGLFISNTEPVSFEFWNQSSERWLIWCIVPGENRTVSAKLFLYFKCTLTITTHCWSVV